MHLKEKLQHLVERCAYANFIRALVCNKCKTARCEHLVSLIWSVSTASYVIIGLRIIPSEVSLNSIFKIY